MKTPQQAAQAWRESAGRAQTNYQEGVQGFQGDWAGATTSQQSTLLTNFQQAVSSGRWAQGVQRVGTNGWKSRTVSKIANYGVGFQAGASRQETAIGKILAAESNIVGSLPPRGTFEQNKARATAVMDGLHALKGTLGA